MRDRFAAMLPMLGVLVQVSLRNLRNHRIKTLIVGSIMFFGTLLVVVGTSLLDSIEASMTRSITSSLSGQLQVYSDKAQDELALFGGTVFDNQNIGEMRDFSKVKDTILAVPNVREVVPMGMGVTTAMTGNQIDEAISNLRAGVSDADADAIASAKEQLLHIVSILREENDNRLAVIDDPTTLAEPLEVLERVASPDFWEAFTLEHPESSRAPAEALEFLDTQLAPLSEDGRMHFLRYIGTDMTAFQRSFDSFYLVRGELVPEGQRGLLLNERNAEGYLKHRVARRFDELKKEVDNGRSIDRSPALQSQIDRLSNQYNRIVRELSPAEARELEARLVELLGPSGVPVMVQDEAPLPGERLRVLLKLYLAVDDATFEARYEFFYDVIAPMIRLYDINIGDVVTLRSMTQGGYLKAVNVKLYGTYHFRGLETSDLAGVGNLIDMLTFRELYGLMSAEELEELRELRESVGVEDIDRDAAEDALFGGGGSLVETAPEPGPDSDRIIDTASPTDGLQILSRQERIDELVNATFTQAQIDEGVALNAAITLHDPALLRETKAAIEAASAQAGLGLKVVHWQAASGLVGQFITVIRLVLYIAIGIIFLIALVIINNAMVMATIERTGEIGTMRAIGAQRPFVMVMFIIETLVLGTLAGSLGAFVGVVAILVAGVVGIPATSDVLVFLFSGPRLYPTVGVVNVFAGLGSILLVSLLSTLYPARVATRIQPITAMRKNE